MLLVLGLAFAVVSWGPLQNLFGGGGDSPGGVYLEYGLPPLIIGLIFVVAAGRLLRRH